MRRAHQHSASYGRRRACVHDRGSPPEPLPFPPLRWGTSTPPLQFFNRRAPQLRRTVPQTCWLHNRRPLAGRCGPQSLLRVVAPQAPPSIRVSRSASRRLARPGWRPKRGPHRPGWTGWSPGTRASNGMARCGASPAPWACSRRNAGRKHWPRPCRTRVATASTAGGIRRRRTTNRASTARCGRGRVCAEYRCCWTAGPPRPSSTRPWPTSLAFLRTGRWARRSPGVPTASLRRVGPRSRPTWPWVRACRRNWLWPPFPSGRGTTSSWDGIGCRATTCASCTQTGRRT